MLSLPKHLYRMVEAQEMVRGAQYGRVKHLCFLPVAYCAAVGNTFTTSCEACAGLW